MSSLEIGTDLTVGDTTDEQRIAAARRIAAQVAAENPHLTARQIANDPQLMQGIRELLNAVLGPQPVMIYGSPGGSVTTTAHTRADVAAVLDLAADTIKANGFCKHYLYNTRQAAGGTDLDRCQVDAIGAINIAVHGTPRHVGGDPLTHAAEQAVEARIDAPSLAAWCDYPGNGKQAAIDLLTSTADALRAEAS
ncbi:DUF6197 family protein [Streptomyces sp. SGAir0957]